VYWSTAALEPTEIAVHIETMQRGMAAAGLSAEDDLSPEEAVELKAMRKQMGASLIRQWKINKSLYEAYSGRIIYQQLGPEPLDAYRQHLQESREAGDFSIANPATAEAFWRYFTDESIHDVMEPESEAAAGAFQTPPWESDS